MMREARDVDVVAAGVETLSDDEELLGQVAETVEQHEDARRPCAVAQQKRAAAGYDEAVLGRLAPSDRRADVVEARRWRRRRTWRLDGRVNARREQQYATNNKEQILRCAQDDT